MSDSLPDPKVNPFPADDELVGRLVTGETARARAQHNFSMERSGSERCLRILVAEVGEAAEAIEDLDLVENAIPLDLEKLRAAEQHLLDEIIQVASAAQRWASIRLRAMVEDAAGDPYIPPKRFFTFNDRGATYLLVVRDPEHGLEILEDLEFGDPSKPFSQAKDEDGDPLALVEMTEGKAATVYVLDDDGHRMPLTEGDFGAMYTTEV